MAKRMDAVLMDVREPVKSSLEDAMRGRPATAEAHFLVQLNDVLLDRRDRIEGQAREISALQAEVAKLKKERDALKPTGMLSAIRRADGREVYALFMTAEHANAYVSALKGQLR